METKRADPKFYGLGYDDLYMIWEWRDTPQSQAIREFISNRIEAQQKHLASIDPQKVTGVAKIQGSLSELKKLLSTLEDEPKPPPNFKSAHIKAVQEMRYGKQREVPEAVV